MAEKASTAIDNLLKLRIRNNHDSCSGDGENHYLSGLGSDTIYGAGGHRCGVFPWIETVIRQQLNQE